MPARLYFKDGRAKVEIALAKGKKEYDKRQTLREKQDRRETDRAISAVKRERGAGRPVRSDPCARPPRGAEWAGTVGRWSRTMALHLSEGAAPP